MPSSILPRRWFLAAAGSLAAWPVLAAALRSADEGSPPGPGGEPAAGKDTFPVKAIASANGLEATRRACQLIRAGADTLDAAITGVTMVEDDPDDTSVGYGGLPNEEGVVELDAAVMHGPTHRAGAVASLRNIRHPSRVARLVLEQSDHALLVGEGALRFARAHGFEEENLLTEKARKVWLYWRQTHSDRDAWLAPPEEELDPDVAKFFKLRGRGAGLEKEAEEQREPRPAAPGGGTETRVPNGADRRKTASSSPPAPSTSPR